MHRYNLRSKAPHLLRFPRKFLENVCRHINLVDLYAFSLSHLQRSELARFGDEDRNRRVHLHFDKKDIEFTVYKGRERLKIKMFNYFKDPKLAPHPSDRQLTVFHNTGVTSAPTVCWNMEDANKEENELHEVNAQDFQNFLEGSHVKDVIDEDTAYEATLEVMNKRNMVVWNALFGGLGNRIPKKLRLVQ
ncbi:unnamed protein product [Caenorhabditis brenneri]